MKRVAISLVLLILLAFGYHLRFTNLKWDYHDKVKDYLTFQHSDERNIFGAAENVDFNNVTLDKSSSLRPGIGNDVFYAYGTFPIYTLKAYAQIYANRAAGKHIDSLHDQANESYKKGDYSATRSSLENLLRIEPNHKKSVELLKKTISATAGSPEQAENEIKNIEQRLQEARKRGVSSSSSSYARQKRSGGTLCWLGRVQSAFFGWISILFIYLLASRMYGVRVGLLSAFFLTFALHHIQTCHYATVETLLTAQLILFLYFCWRWVNNTGWKGWLDTVMLGIIFGAAFATKLSSLAFAAPLGTAWLLRIWVHWNKEEKSPNERLRTGIASLLLTAVLLCCASFTVFPVLESCKYFDGNPRSSREHKTDLRNRQAWGEKLIGKYIKVPRLAKIPRAQWDSYKSGELTPSERLRFGLEVNDKAENNNPVVVCKTPLLLNFPNASAAPLRTLCALVWLSLHYALIFFMYNLALPILLGLAIAFAILAKAKPFWQTSQRMLLMPVAILLIGLIIGFSLAPMQIIENDKWRERIGYERTVVDGSGDVPYTRQFTGSISYLFQLRNMVDYSLGEPLGILGILGMLGIMYWAFSRIGKKREICGASWLLLSFAVPYFYLIGGWHAKFLRYMIPLYPFFIIGAAWLLVKLWDHYNSFRARVWVGSITAATLIFCFFYAFALQNMFSVQNTRMAASDWMYDNAKRGSRILSEHWDDGVPTNTAKSDNGRAGFHKGDLAMYDDDRPSKVTYLANKLQNADYVMWGSKRLYGSILRQPNRYPISGRFYRMMFTGHLGFEPVKVVTSYPNIFGYQFNDDMIEESARCYDHPKVTIFKKVRKVSTKDMSKYLRSPPPEVDSITLEDILKHQDKRSIYEHTSSHPGWRWFLFFQLMAVVGFPITFVLAKRLPDCGWGLSRTLSLLLLGYGSWILASVRLVPFSRIQILIVFLALSAVSGWLYRRNREEMTARVKECWKWMLGAEFVYLGLYIVYLVIRMYNPDVYWGEKPMDLSFLASTYRSHWFPPLDPWYGGHTVNYYYLGHTLLAIVGKFLNLPVGHLYNLAIALIPALTGAAAFSIILTVCRRAWAAIVGAWLLTLGGSLWTAALWIHNHIPNARQHFNLNNDAQHVDYIQTLSKEWLFQSISTYWHALKNFCALLFSGVIYYNGPQMREGGFDNAFFWRAGHDVIKGTAANEFPAWTFLFADLHAHMIVIPFTLLFIGLAFSLLKMDRCERVVKWVLLTALALCLGAVTCINTWDLPTCAGLLLMVLLWRWWHLDRQDPLGRTDIERSAIFSVGGFVSSVLMPMALVVIGAFSLYAPFHTNFHSRVEVGTGAVMRSWGSNTSPLQFFMFFGVMLFFVFWYLIARLCNPRPHENKHSNMRKVLIRFITIAILLLAGIIASRHFMDPAVRLALKQSHNLPHNVTLDYRLLVFLLPFALWAAWHFLASRKRSEAGAALLCMMGLGLAAGVEFFYIKEGWGFPGHRYNTVFKFYIQIWIYLSLAAGAALGLMARHCVAQKRASNILARIFLPIHKWVLSIGLFLLLPLTLIFPVVGTYSVTKSGGARCTKGDIPSLDGLSWFRKQNPEDYNAMKWLQCNIKGQPMVLEAVGEQYDHSTSHISTQTGLPTIVGWIHHVKERVDSRTHTEIDRTRPNDIRTIYKSNDKRKVMNMLHKYNVQYIFVGARERRLYGRVDRHFSGYGDEMDLVFKNKKASIYKVRRNMNKEVMGEVVVESAPQDLPPEPGKNLFSGGKGFANGEFREPRGIAVSKDRIYIADTANNRVQVFHKNGKYIFSIGEEGDSEGEMREPNDVVLDATGNVVVLDSMNNRVQVFDPKGRFLDTWGGEQGFFGPRAITRDPRSGWFYITDTGNGRIRVFTPEGKQITSFGSYGKGTRQFDNPSGIAVHNDRVYILDRGNVRVVVTGTRGNLLAAWPFEYSSPPNIGEPKLVVTPDGRVIIADTEGHRILVYSEDGKLQHTLGNEAQLQHVIGMAISPDGKSLYACDKGKCKVIKYALPGK
jgi:YYY domain-containing protein